jgi:hypothetical protein
VDTRLRLPSGFRLRAGILVALVGVAILVRTISGCGGPSTLAARVGGTTIRTDRVDAIVDHARTEAKREGKRFPAKGTAAYAALRRQALDLLVFNEELAQKAAKLGISVTAADFTQPTSTPRLELPGSEPETDLYSAFVLETRRQAILYRKVYARVSRDLTVTHAELAAYLRSHPGAGVSREQVRRNLLDTKRNARMAAWIAALKRDFEGKVEYGPAFQG